MLTMLFLPANQNFLRPESNEALVGKLHMSWCGMCHDFKLPIWS